MTAERDSVSPELSDLAVTYISYKPEDDLHVKVDIRDAEGAVAYTFHELRPNLQLGRNQSFNLTWNTANTLPGMYTANAELYVRGEKNAEGQDEFEILPGELSATLDGSVTTDKLEYSGNETVRITSRVNNLSANSPVSSLAVNVKTRTSGTKS